MERLTSGASRPPVQTMMGKTEGGRRKGGWWGEVRRSIAWTITKRDDNTPNPHNVVDSRDGAGRNIPIGWVTPMLHEQFIPFSLYPLVTSRQERQRLSQRWVDNLPPSTGLTSKICPSAEYRWGNRSARGEEVVKKTWKAYQGNREPHRDWKK